MNALMLRLVLAGGKTQAVLLGACAAAVSALLLVAVTVLALPGSVSEPLYGVIADPGTRGGYLFALVMLTVPALLLMRQVVRFGTGAQARRLAALRLAGMTPAEVRRVAAAEKGVPALVGAVLGIGVFWLLRSLVGGPRYYADDGALDGMLTPIGLVPVSVAPTWWQYLLVIVGVAGIAALLGALTMRSITVGPLGLVRRAPRKAPRPWGLLPIVGAVLLLAPIGVVDPADHLLLAQIAAFSALALLIVGVVGLAPWIAYRMGLAVSGRARSAVLLLAARRLVADPRAVGRAASAMGGIGLVSGGLVIYARDLMSGAGDGQFFYLWSGMLVAATLPYVLVTVLVSLMLHSLETSLESQRSTAALVAMGLPTSSLTQVIRWEIALVAVPVTVLSAVLTGALGMTLLGGLDFSPWAMLVVAVVALLVLVLGTVWLVSLLVGSWVRRTADVTHLRTA